AEGRTAVLVLVVFLVLFSAGAAVAGTYMLKPIINEIIPLIGKAGEAGAFIPLAKKVILLLFVYALGAFSTYAQARIMLNVSQNTLNTIRKDLFEHLQDLPISYFDKNTHGELMSRFTNDTDTVREAVSQIVPQMISAIVTVVSTFIMMLVLSPILTLMIILMLVIMFIIIKTIGSKSSKNFRRQQKAVGSANGYIEEITEGLKVVKVFCHEKKVKEEFAVRNEELRDSATKANTYASILMPIMGNLSYMNYALTATIGGLLLVNGVGRLDIGSVAAFLQYTRSFSQPITQFSQQVNVLLAALAGAERIFDVLDETPEEDNGFVTLTRVEKEADGRLTKTDKRTGFWAWENTETGELVELKGDVRFNNVTFSYDGRKTVLKNVSLYAKPGQKIAFVGSTGAGKTTITNLINRFYEISDGEITYDGIDIKNIKKDALRGSLAVVLQDTHLFTGTVRENIRYGKLDATDEEIYAAAKLANADSFIERLPDGYDTMLTSDGMNLSQGQRQLLAIARAAVADPPVLILDEATSSIDTRTERNIEKGMDSLMKDRTVFVIAHRLSTVRNSNAIMVLENGEIIERGDHESLLADEGKYYQLYTGQFELE
ncbi:MAG: ABC transporter ATP-binding protein, partial [Clostridia bacterium]|nr:ABC transporter ATP-binding protein [Clostridia bacterium]